MAFVDFLFRRESSHSEIAATPLLLYLSLFRTSSSILETRVSPRRVSLAPEKEEEARWGKSESKKVRLIFHKSE